MTKNIMTIPCINGKFDLKEKLSLLFVLRKQQSKLDEICSFLDYLHFDVLNLSLTPSPEIGVLESIYEMKRVIISQQSQLDMMRTKTQRVRVSSRCGSGEKAWVYRLIIILLFLVGLRIIYLLPSPDLVSLQGNKILYQEEVILSQAEKIASLEEELRQTREFYGYFTKTVVWIVCIGVMITGVRMAKMTEKIQQQEKFIVDQIYQALLGDDSGKKMNKPNLALPLLSSITLFVFVMELYLVSSLF